MIPATVLYGFRYAVKYLSKIANFSYPSCIITCNAPVRIIKAEFRRLNDKTRTTKAV